MSDTGVEWQVARRRKGAARRAQPPLTASPCQDDQLDTGKTIKRIRETMSDLRCEEFWKKWKELLTMPGLIHTSESSDGQSEKNTPGRTDREQHCVCYGLGSFSSCVSARYQLAILLLLLDTLQVRKRSVKVTWQEI